MTFDATVNPVIYEGGIPVFIDIEKDTWNIYPFAFYVAIVIKIANTSNFCDFGCNKNLFMETKR